MDAIVEGMQTSDAHVTISGVTAAGGNVYGDDEGAYDGEVYTINGLRMSYRVMLEIEPKMKFLWIRVTTDWRLPKG